MDPSTASFWLDALAAGAGVLWLVGAWFVWRTQQRVAEPLRGEVQVSAKASDVLARFTSHLAMSTTMQPFQRARIEAATTSEVRWHCAGAAGHRGTLQVATAGNAARVRFEIAQASTLTRIAFALVVLGAVVTAGLWSVLGTYVATSDDPAVRAQVVQMVQAIHVLWPPFLLAGLARMQRKRVAAEVHRVLHNLPFTATLAGNASPL